MSLLVSTKIYATNPGVATRVARDWRVVMVSDDNNSIDVLGLYEGIANHTFDPLEPFLAFEGDKSIKAQIGRSQVAKDYQDIPLSVKLADAARSFGIYFKFFVLLGPKDASSDNHQQGSGTPKDARKILMEARCRVLLPSPPSVAGQQRNGKLAMRAGIRRWLDENHLGWSPDIADSMGKDFINAFTEVLWCIDGHEGTLAARACQVPKDLEVLLGYNKPEKSKHRRKDIANLSCDILDHHVSTLNHFLLHSWTRSAIWTPVRKIIMQLLASLCSYVKYLKQKNAEMKKNHSMSLPVRNIVDSVLYTSIKAAVWVRPSLAAKYAPLESILLTQDFFTPVFVNDYAPADVRARRSYIDDLKNGVCLKLKAMLSSYNTGNSLGSLHFLWRIPNSDDITEENMAAGNAEAARVIQPGLPTFHTRAMRKQFFHDFSLFRCARPAVLKEIYRQLTGDFSSPSNFDESETQERIRLIIDTQDPDIVDDLRRHNKGRPSMYDRFWDECRKFLEEEVETAVDERRHGNATHLAKAHSTWDLLNCVAKRCPSGTPLPSEQWLRLQFWPKNATMKSALQYTGRFQVKFMVQPRQLRKWHEDAHYCAALFKYVKEFGLRYKAIVDLVFLDDKHRCKVGEPGIPVAAVERGKQVIVTMSGKKFSVADHDFTKCGMIPSVMLFCDIPTTIEESFYSGQVYVGLKDPIFKPSSALRHAIELGNIIARRCLNNPVLVMYTDGGPDHNVTFLKTQLSLISLYLSLNLDMLIAVRTAPCHSWKNPCERVNCILNIGLQAIGLMRSCMSAEHEKSLSTCNAMKEIRKLSNPGFEEALCDSLESVKLLMSSVFQRLVLKDKPFQIFKAASKHQMDALWNVVGDVDPNLKVHMKGKKDLRKCPVLKAFMDHCCQIRHYSFSIKKCGKQECNICLPPRLQPDVFSTLAFLPDPVPADDQHYKKFDDIYGTLTSEKHRPSLKDEGCKQSHDMPLSPSAQTAANVGELILCSECLRPRVMYSQRKLGHHDIDVLIRSIEDTLYVCGSRISDIEVILIPSDPPSTADVMKRVFVRANLSCRDDIEVPFYSSECFASICSHCACECDKHVKGQYPLCSDCASEGVRPLLKRKRKMFTPHH